MMKKDRRHTWWILILILVIAAAIAGYFFGMDKEPEQKDEPVITKKEPSKIKEVPKESPEKVPEETLQIKKQMFSGKETGRIIEPEEKMPIVQEDPCTLIEDQLREFFNYLNKKSYIQRIEKGLDTYDRFKVLIKKLSSRPPISSGEGLDKEIMIRNAFYFFRVLGRNDIRLIKGVLKNEADTLEMNLELLYEWLMLGYRCPDKGIRPSPELSYIYAGYFLNTLGGRAYLFRRPTGIRLLVNYYCLLLLHEADKKGKNRYGIDIFPEIDALLKDISLNPDLRFQGDYIDRLTKIQGYYLKKR
ncbi:hypothetical protein ACFL0H_03235 [Thermodesulfobacteriota bacterium]